MSLLMHGIQHWMSIEFKRSDETPISEFQNDEE